MFGQGLGINGAIILNPLARSFAQIADSKTSKSEPLTSIEVPAC